jgi:hypothetical protein
MIKDFNLIHSRLSQKIFISLCSNIYQLSKENVALYPVFAFNLCEFITKFIALTFTDVFLNNFHRFAINKYHPST